MCSEIIRKCQDLSPQTNSWEHCTLCNTFIIGFSHISFLFSLSQIPDGVPIHLKRGVPDRLLYRTTMALTIGGTLYCLVALYFAAQPNNKWSTQNPRTFLKHL